MTDTSLLAWIAVGLTACGDGATLTSPVVLSEVSTLSPLPANATERDLMLRPSDVGAKGALIPTWAMPNPALVQNEDRQLTIDNLRLVASRLDPCWPSIAETDLRKCQRVLHLVWQPIVDAWTTGATTLAAADAAVHTFHRLTDEELTGLLAGLDELRETADAAAPLDVHPTLAAQGLSGAYFAGWKRLVLANAGADNLFEMTFLALRATTTSRYVGQGWLMSGAAFEDGQIFRVPVATTTDDEQHFGNNVAGSTPVDEQSAFLGDFTPAAPNTDVLLAVVGDSQAALSADLATVQRAIDLTLTVENPLRTTLESADCMSCHVATSARRWAEQNRGIDVSANPNRYTNPDFDLTLTSQSIDRSNAIHGLGWYGVHTAISQRTVNDTAAAASFINANLVGN